MEECIGLMSADLLKKSPAVEKLMEKFEKELPSHFGKARFIAVPPNTSLEHVIRADCKECRTRAFVHVIRENHVLNIKEVAENGEVLISYDRNLGCCDECKKLFT